MKHSIVTTLFYKESDAKGIKNDMSIIDFVKFKAVADHR